LAAVYLLFYVPDDYQFYFFSYKIKPDAFFWRI